MAFFSVIIPVYNVKAYLERCVESVLKQSFTDYEIILVDDGSTDGSEHICDDYEKKLANCTVVHQDNKGLSGARNTGLKYAKGKYIFFLDSDDYIENCLLKRIYDVIENDAVDVVGFNATVIFEGRDDELFATTNGKSGIQWGLMFAEKCTPKSPVPLYCYKNDFLIENELSFYEGIYYEDILFTAQVFLKNPRVIFLDERLYFYVKREGSITTSMVNTKKYEDIVLIDETLIKEALCFTQEIGAFRRIMKSHLMLSEEVYFSMNAENKKKEKLTRKQFWGGVRAQKKIIGLINYTIASFPYVFFTVRRIRNTLRQR